MIYGYVRVSTKAQVEGYSIGDHQQEILKRYPDAEIIIESASGAKERDLFNDLLARMQAGDTLVVTTLDRFCRTAKEGLEYVDAIQRKGAIIHILNMGILDDSVVGKLITTVLLAFAEFERQSIIERTQRGKAIAKQNPDFRDGRPKKYSKQQIEHALVLMDYYSAKQVEEKTGISQSTLFRAKRAHNSNSADRA